MNKSELKAFLFGVFTCIILEICILSVYFSVLGG